MLLPSQHRELTEAYKEIYHGETDDISDLMLEEVVEELIDECVKSGYDLDEAADLVESATIEYLDEAKVTYGSDTESPEQRKARAKEKHGAMKSAARKAAVKGAVSRVKAKATGAAAAAGIAGSIAKDEARRAGRAAVHGAKKAAGAISAAAQQKKAQVKSGVKKLLGKGLRAVAGGAGRVAQTARKAGAAAGKAATRLGEEVDLFDVILEYLVAEGFADTNEAALVIMANMSEEWREEIVEETTTQRLARRASEKADEPGAKTDYKPQGPGFKNPRSRASIMNQIASRAKTRSQHGVDSQYGEGTPQHSEQPRRGGRSGRGSKTDRPGTANMPNPNRKPKQR